MAGLNYPSHWKLCNIFLVGHNWEQVSMGEMLRNMYVVWEGEGVEKSHRITDQLYSLPSVLQNANLVCILLHDYTLRFNGSPSYNADYYNYNSIWPYYIHSPTYLPACPRWVGRQTDMQTDR